MLDRIEEAYSIVEKIDRGEVSCVETIERALDQIPAVEEACNPFTCILGDEALDRARALDSDIEAGVPARLLQGVPICIKDMTPSKGHPTTLGSLTSGDGLTQHDAVIVERLKDAGAVIVAKTTTAEFAFSSFTKSIRYGATRNPWGLSRTSGGSSGGSAVAVAAGVVPLAEGSDMGGSVRIPAAACGVVGFKPSLGRIPMDIVPVALETISHFGPLASCVADAALFVAATSGHHPSDMLSQTRAFYLDKTKPQDLRGRRIAISTDLGYCHVDQDIHAALLSVADLLREHGATVDTITLPWTREIFDQWAIRWNCLLAQFPNSGSEKNLAMMDPDLAECIRKGRATSATDLMGVDAFRAKLNAQLNETFANFEALICPTNAVPAPALEKSDADFEATLPSGKFRAFDMTHPFNMVPSSPVLSLPIGLTSSQLPIGMQIVGKPYADEETLSLAASIEALLPTFPVPDFRTE